MKRLNNSILLTKETHFKIKVLSALCGLSMDRFMDRLIGKSWEKEQETLVDFGVAPKIAKEAREYVRKIKDVV